MKNKPHYGYYALLVVGNISAILLIAGAIAFISISRIFGAVLDTFAIYTFAAYYPSIRSLRQSETLNSQTFSG